MQEKKGVLRLILLVWVLGAFFAGSGGLRTVLYAGNGEKPVVVYASKSSTELKKDVDAKQKQAERAKAEKKELEQEIAALQEKKQDVTSCISTLDKKLEKLTVKMEANKKRINRVKGEISRLEAEHQEAEDKKENQYAAMKKRIKYIYEDKNQSYFELLFSSGSLSELFNRFEYISKVTNYDKKMIAKYQNTCSVLAESEKKLAEKLEVLQDGREALAIEKQSVDTLAEVKRIEIAEYQSVIQNKNLILENTEVLLESQERELEKLMEEQRRAAAEEAKAKEEAKHNPDSSSAPADGYVWPLTVSGTITSEFGLRTAPAEGASTFHKGIDIAVPVGTSVLAANAGTVITASYSASAGNYLCISHGGGVYTYYMHLSALKVKEKKKVKKGQRIALSGNTGISTGPHLHFAVYAGGEYVNPMNYVSR